MNSALPGPSALIMSRRELWVKSAGSLTHAERADVSKWGVGGGGVMEKRQDVQEKEQTKKE